MIEQNTVFILGAGSSVPYGYPTGKRLRHNIIFSSKGMLDNLINGNPKVPMDTLSLYKSQIDEFLTDFKRSATPSIDLFLSRNKKYSEIGKLSIAISILHAETKSKFVEDIDTKYQDWYSFLLHRMTEKLPKPDGYKKFAQNQVSFITFNYDRSFDYFIHDSIIHSFTEIDKGNANFKEIIPFPIIHVYGSLSKLPWQKHHSYYYRSGQYDESIRDFEMINAMSKNIGIIQDRTNDHDIAKAKKLISEAERVIFLGFGYADENLDILGIPDIFQPHHSVYGTVFGYKHQEIMRTFDKLSLQKAKKYSINKPVYVCGKFMLADYDCLDLLREYL